MPSVDISIETSMEVRMEKRGKRVTSLSASQRSCLPDSLGVERRASTHKNLQATIHHHHHHHSRGRQHHHHMMIIIIIILRDEQTPSKYVIAYFGSLEIVVATLKAVRKTAKSKIK